MTSPKPIENQPTIDSVVDDILRQMDDVTADSPEFEKMTDQLVKLEKLKAETGPKKISPDVLATIAANLAGILVIVGHERTHIITSKALSFVLKLR